MSKSLQKSLQDYLSRIKKPPTPNIHFSSKQLSSSTSWILRGCKHPKTLSFAVDSKQNQCRDKEEDDDNAATLSDIDRFLFENFKSLYEKDNHEDKKKKEGYGDDDHEEKLGGYLFDSPKFMDPPPDLCGSHRFFVAPGSSSSLIEEARTSTTMSDDMGSSSTTTTTLNDSARNRDDHVKEVMGPDDFIALFTYSASPSDDFQRSMQEMIEARLRHHGKVDWEFMEELLFCYMNLNDKKSYKYILSAFVDLIVVLRENSGKLPARSRHFRPTGESRKKRNNVTLLPILLGIE
ncbi:hypothetical protein F0562_024657 [Nyssa sinensis]|uniref:Transcription repressor n=1 Tax=Nyssa sinensis TaxID=561372 RepID=A0A5J5BCP0_9ASTE|nr:hypothetical protein F0562_024657 [Nyssa sinensis]